MEILELIFIITLLSVFIIATIAVWYYARKCTSDYYGENNIEYYSQQPPQTVSSPISSVNSIPEGTPLPQMNIVILNHENTTF